MKDEDLHRIRAIAVDVVCFRCEGTGRVPGGQREYGEMVSCQICFGIGTVGASITADQLRKLLAGNH